MGDPFGCRFKPFVSRRFILVRHSSYATIRALRQKGVRVFAHRALQILVACGLGLLIQMPSAQAQVTAGVGLASDYRLRGLSLTDYDPAATLSLAYDDASGIYAGGTAIVSSNGDHAHFVGATGYAGYTHRLTPDLLLDMGASYQNYTLYFKNRGKLEYAEVYGGLIWRNISTHLYFKPNNPRVGVDFIYSDLNWSAHPWRRWRVSSHAGLAERIGGTDARDGARRRLDMQLGVTREFAHAELEVSYVGTVGDKNPHALDTHPGALIGGRYFF